MATTKRESRLRIKRRVRGKINGSTERPRLSVYRSNKQIYAQIIDDVSGRTLASASSLKLEKGDAAAKIDQASLVGKAIADAARAAGVEAVVFDRNGYLYHGRIKQLAEAAREGGLKF